MGRFSDHEEISEETPYPPIFSSDIEAKSDSSFEDLLGNNMPQSSNLRYTRQ